MAVPQGRAAVVVAHLTDADQPLIPFLSVIIPVYKDAEPLKKLLTDLKAITSIICEVVVVDGSRDEDLKPLIEAFSDVRFIESEPQRAGQMNAGAKHATGEILWFLHADTRLPENIMDVFLSFRKQTARVWGRFNVELDSKLRSLKLVAFMMNKRSAITSIATGDQGFFLFKDTFLNIQGFPAQSLMEDIEFSKKLKSLSRPYIPKVRLTTSSRKWLSEGIFKTIRTMWYLRFIYWLGASPDRIHQLYYGASKEKKS